MIRPIPLRLLATATLGLTAWFAVSTATVAKPHHTRHASATPASEAQPQSDSADLNVSGDSAPDWAPSPVQQHQASSVANAYFAAIDAGKYAKAYGLTTVITRRGTPLAKFTADNRDGRDQTGPLVKRLVNKMTFTKDPDSAPVKGIYVSVDFSARFTNADRDCGYVVLYQKRPGLPFQVMRAENNFLTNAKAKEIADTAAQTPPPKPGFLGKKDVKAPDTPDTVWAKIAANCPNYTPLP